MQIWSCNVLDAIVYVVRYALNIDVFVHNEYNLTWYKIVFLLFVNVNGETRANGGDCIKSTY